MVDSYSQSAKIYIKQDSIIKEVLYDSSIITLKKKPFNIEVRLINLRGVFASISYDSTYYNTPTGTDFKDWKYIGTKSMVEHNFNEKKMVIIDDNSLHYWLYDSTLKWHRFDKGIIINGDTVTATKTVERFMDRANDRVIFPVENIDRPLLLVFFSTDPKNKTRIPVELFRKKVVLKFE